MAMWDDVMSGEVIAIYTAAVIETLENTSTDALRLVTTEQRTKSFGVQSIYARYLLSFCTVLGGQCELKALAVFSAILTLLYNNEE